MKKFFIQLLPINIVRKIQTYKLGYRLLTEEEYYLKECGYLDTFFAQKPINAEGEYVPWMNYDMIQFLDARLNKTQTIFEYGAGYSTLYYAKKVKEICALEYDENWKSEVEVLLDKNKITNATLLYNEVNEEYPTRIKNPENALFDIVIVDGRKRVKCAKYALNYLSEKGIVILDDSSRMYYAEVFTFYKGKGFKEITFCGIKPTGYKNDHTTIFYRPNNCFDS